MEKRQTDKGKRDEGPGFTIYEMLGTGEGQAKTARELCAALGMRPRELTKAIERERRRGFVICAGCGPNKGYYRPGDRREAETYLSRLDHRIAQVKLTRDAMAREMRP